MNCNMYSAGKKTQQLSFILATEAPNGREKLKRQKTKQKTIFVAICKKEQQLIAFHSLKPEIEMDILTVK